jgi:hypothetical protein
MREKGGCYCGDIRYEVDGDLEGAIQCHCRECQYITGGNPNVIAVFSEKDFKYTKGKVATFSRKDLDNPVHRHFCPNCGTGIGTRSPAKPNSMILKIGTFDDQSFFNPQAAIFTCDKQHYHIIADGVSAFEKRP